MKFVKINLREGMCTQKDQRGKRKLGGLNHGTKNGFLLFITVMESGTVMPIIPQQRPTLKI